MIAKAFGSKTLDGRMGRDGLTVFERRPLAAPQPTKGYDGEQREGEGGHGA